MGLKTVARIRTIKPEFPQSESMGRVSRDARLLFVLLWTVADDVGRLRAPSRLLASLLFPFDEDASSLIDTWLQELEGERSIQRYEADGNTYIQISKWLEHQKIDKPSKSRLPNPPDILASPREPSPKPLEASSGDLGPSERKKEENKNLVRPSDRTVPKRRLSEVEDDFNRLFWKPYPRSQNMSRLKTLEAWRKLSAPDRDAAAAAVPKYIAWLKTERVKKPDHQTVHAVRFITQRRFEGFNEPPDPEAASQAPLGEPLFKHGDFAPASAGRIAGYIYWKSDTPEWDRWVVYNRSRGRGSPAQDKFGGWFFPTAAPPE